MIIENIIKINNKINLQENSPSCTPQCKEYLDYISDYAKASSHK
jgi:hypothetical protein